MEQLALSSRDVRVARRKCKSKSAIRRRTGKETLEAGLIRDWTDMADLTIHIPAKNKHWHTRRGETMQRDHISPIGPSLREAKEKRASVHTEKGVIFALQG